MTSKYQQAALGELAIASNPAARSAGLHHAASAVPELAIAGARTEIVFIEDNVPDIDTLIRGFGAGKEIVILDATRDGLQQIVDALEGRGGVDALHIVSHGAAGALNLGQLTLDAANLNAHEAALQTIGASLAPGADILLYGCGIGAGEGANFVGQLAIATGADIAASDDLTGGLAAGGDWELEVTHGDIEARVTIDPALAAHYAGVLAAGSTVTFDSDANFIERGIEYGAGADENSDVVYQVGGDSEHLLVISGDNENVFSLDQAAGASGAETYVVISLDDRETGASLHFRGGQAFTISDMSGSALQWNTPGYIRDQTLLLTGLTADNRTVTTNWSITTIPYPGGDVPPYTWHAPDDLSAFVDIVSLTITTTESSGILKYIAIDNLEISDIHDIAKAPEVVSVTSSTSNNKVHKVGDTFEISVVYDQAVVVDTTNGRPTLQLETGNPDSKAVFTRSDDAKTLVFTYTVLAGDHATDLAYAGTAALDPAGGSIKLSGDTLDADLALPTPGGAGSLNANNAIRLDGVAPSAPQAPLLHSDSNSGSKADTITYDRTPTFYGVAESVEGGATVRLFADGQPIGSVVAAANGSWSLASDELDEGTYSITAEAVDLAGNVSAASSGTTLTIDFTVPTAGVDDVAFSDDTGAAGDFVTRVADQAVSGTLTAPLAAGEWVGVSIDNGVTYSPAAVSPEGDRWSLADAEIEGKGTLWVRVFDAAGNGGTPFSHAYELDAAAPGKPSTPDLTDASDSGSDNQDNITGVTMPTFTGTAEKDATITLYADGEAVGTAKADTDGKWSVTVDEALGGGAYAFTVRATDLAGNQGVASDALDVTIITDAPETVNLSFSLGTDSGEPDDGITNVAAQLLQGELSAALGAGEKVQVRIAGGSWQEATIVQGTTGWTLDTTLAPGEKKVEVQVVNAIGNNGPVSSYDYVLDTDAPTVEIESDKLELKAGETATITFTFSDAPGAAFTEEAIKVTGGTLTEFDGEGLVWTALFTPDADTQDGEASISIGAGLFTDLAGNESLAAVPASLTFDTVRPETSAPVLAAASDTGWSNADGVTASSRPTFTGSAESGATVTLYDANDNVIGSGTAVNGKWSIAPVANLANGKHTISARAVDVNGNESELVAGQEITIDTTPPTVTITSDVDKLKIGETATITFTFSEDPGATFTRADVTVVGGTLGALEKDGLTFTAVFTPTDDANATTASITIGAGSYVDQAGNNGGPGITPTLTFDTRAPGAPSVPDLDPESDTGTSDEDDITGDTIPTFSGTAEPGVTVRLFANGVEIGSGVATDGNWSITSRVVLVADEYDITAVATDAFGNEGPPSDPLRIEISTNAPTTVATSLKFSADTGVSQTDLVTKTAAQTISGALDADLKAGEYVEVSVDGGKNWNRASVDADGWSIATTLVVGEEAVAVRVANAIGNTGTEYSRNYHLDTLAPGVTITSNVDELKRGENATITFTFTEDPGATFTWDGAVGDVAVSGGTLTKISGSGATRTATFMPTDGFEGNASITVAGGGYTDLAGNTGADGATPTLAIDTSAPDAPDAPKLAVDSDTGEKGDGRTESTTQVIEGGGAEPGAMVYLYNGNQRIGSSQANAEGLWSIDVALGGGTYALSVTQDDEAGNESAKSDPFQLTVTVSNPNPNPNPDPDPTPNPPTVIDGMPVTTTPVTLPGGVRGTTVAVPIVSGGRDETDGQASLADIPLASSSGQTQLLAQLPIGYGLSSSGASVGAASGLEFLIASIRAATPTHAPDDQGHLVQNGTSFLQGLNYSSLLVHTIKPVSNPGTTDALVLTGFNPSGGQGTALVIETAGLANDAAIELVDVDFAALVGAATVYTGSNGSILAGDGASQHFTVLAGNNNGVFAGGGSDLLTFAAGAPVDAGSASGRASAQQAAASGTTTLHGGQGGDAASFAGVRADYDIETHNGYLVVTSKAAPDAKALVVNVEELRFGDGNVAVENGAGLNTLAGMYQTVFGRQADLFGFEFWADHRDHGVSWGTVALELIASSERVAQHGDFNGDAANDIGLLYQALFDREADAQGLAYWQAAMEERGMSLEQVATSFVESAEMVGHQRGVLDWDFLV